MARVRTAQTRYRLFTTQGTERTLLCECKSRDELEKKFIEYQQIYGAHEDPTKDEHMNTGDNRFFIRHAVGGKKDGKDLRLFMHEMTSIPGGIMA